MVVITEQWVRERVGLEYNQLHNVRSLFLPGSRDEKVSYLGAALQNFSRLKNLDLSSNALVSLEGLHSLDGLEKLNLYFNRLPDLTELFRLRHNRHLVEVDLRLNPVATQDPQYRLFLVHLLPMLQRLDDMAVMSSERAAAAGIFTTDQLEQFGMAASPTRVPLDLKAHPRSGAEGLPQSGPVVALPDLATDILHDLLTDEPPGKMSGSWRQDPAAITDEIQTPHIEPDFRYSTNSISPHKNQPGSSRRPPQQPYEDSDGATWIDARHTSVSTLTQAPVGAPSKSPSVTTEMLAETARAIIPLVEEYRRPGMLLSFQFQERVIRVLEALLVQPLLDGMASTVGVLKEDAVAAEAKFQQLTQERDMAVAAQGTLEEEIERVLLGKVAAAVTASNDGMASRLRKHVDGLCTEIESIQRDLHAERARRQEHERKLQTQIEQLRKDVTEQSAAVTRAQVRAAELEQAALAEAAIAHKERPDVEQLVGMLRESQDSLSAAGHRAAAALEQERAKHQAELTQLRWNYAELKRTADLLIS